MEELENKIYIIDLYVKMGDENIELADLIKQLKQAE